MQCCRLDPAHADLPCPGQGGLPRGQRVPEALGVQVHARDQFQRGRLVGAVAELAAQRRCGPQRFQRGRQGAHVVLHTAQIEQRVRLRYRRVLGVVDGQRLGEVLLGAAQRTEFPVQVAEIAEVDGAPGLPAVFRVQRQRLGVRRLGPVHLTAFQVHAGQVAERRRLTLDPSHVAGQGQRVLVVVDGRRQVRDRPMCTGRTQPRRHLRHAVAVQLSGPARVVGRGQPVRGAPAQPKVSAQQISQAPRDTPLPVPRVVRDHGEHVPEFRVQPGQTVVVISEHRRSRVRDRVIGRQAQHLRVQQIGGGRDRAEVEVVQPSHDLVPPVRVFLRCQAFPRVQAQQVVTPVAVPVDLDQVAGREHAKQRNGFRDRPADQRGHRRRAEPGAR